MTNLNYGYYLITINDYIVSVVNISRH